MSDLLYDLKSAAPLLTLAAITLGLVVACHPTNMPEPVIQTASASLAPTGVSFRHLGKTPQNGDAYIMTVAATGCEYIYVEMFQNGVAVTPHMARYNNDGIRTFHRGCRGGGYGEVR